MCMGKRPLTASANPGRELGCNPHLAVASDVARHFDLAHESRTNFSSGNTYERRCASQFATLGDACALAGAARGPLRLSWHL